MERNPVVLVHGIDDSSRKMVRLAQHLQAVGWETHALDLHPNCGRAGLDELAGQLDRFLVANVADASRVDLIGFSMGGLVARYYLQRLGGLERCDRFITIASPHGGSMMAWLRNGPGCRQMRPGSEFLRDLASDAERLKALQFTSLWTPLDLMIVPPTSSLLPYADCVLTWCVAHPLMVSQKDILRMIEKLLSAPRRLSSEAAADLAVEAVQAAKAGGAGAV